MRIERNLPGAINKVVERNCIGAGQAALDEVLPDPVSDSAEDGRAVPDPHPDGGGGHRARGARPQQRVAGGDGRAARQPARRRGPQDDRLHLRRPGLRSADAGAAAAVRLARRGGRGQLLRDPALLAGRGRDRPRACRRTRRRIGTSAPTGSSTSPASPAGRCSGRAPASASSPRGSRGKPRPATRSASRCRPSERDGKRHEIKVALRRERGVTVRHRTEFTAEPRSRRLGKAPETLAAALSAPVMLQAVPLRVATTLVPDGSTQPKVLMAAAVGASALTGRYARTRLAYEVLDGDGRRYGETEEVDAVTPLYTVALRLRPGRYRVKVAAKDSEGRIGSVEHPFEVTPPPAEGIHVGRRAAVPRHRRDEHPDPAGRRAGRGARHRRARLPARFAGRGDGRHRRERRGHAPRRTGEPLQRADGHHVRQGGHRLRAGRQLLHGALAGRPLSRRRGRAQGRLADRARRAHVRRRRRRRRRGARDHHDDDHGQPRGAALGGARRRCCPARPRTPTATRRAPCRRCPRSATSRPSSTAR